MDSFCEHLIKRKKKISEKVTCVFLIIMAVLFTVFAFLWLFPVVHAIFRDATTLVFPLVVAVWWGILTLIKRYNIEYEYALTGSDIDIDKIINKKKRKRILSVSLRTFSIVSPVNSSRYTEQYKSLITVDCSSGAADANTFFAVYRIDGQQKCLIFDPTEKMLSHIKLYCRDNFYLS